jgi:hypothetical protein
MSGEAIRRSSENIVRIRAMDIRTPTMLLALVVMFANAIARVPRGRAPSSDAHADVRDLGAADTVSWSVQTSGIDTNLRGVSATEFVDSNGKENISVWACGSNGVILLSNDLGKTWKRLHLARGDALDSGAVWRSTPKTPS